MDQRPYEATAEQFPGRAFLRCQPFFRSFHPSLRWAELC